MHLLVCLKQWKRLGKVGTALWFFQYEGFIGSRNVLLSPFTLQLGPTLLHITTGSKELGGPEIVLKKLVEKTTHLFFSPAYSQ